MAMFLGIKTHAGQERGIVPIRMAFHMKPMVCMTGYNSSERLLVLSVCTVAPRRRSYSVVPAAETGTIKEIGITLHTILLYCVNTLTRFCFRFVPMIFQTRKCTRLEITEKIRLRWTAILQKKSLIGWQYLPKPQPQASKRNAIENNKNQIASVQIKFNAP
jgi:hypothetical protein